MAPGRVAQEAILHMPNQYTAHPVPTDIRFWSKVEFTGTCWLWTAHKDRDGYGRFSLMGRDIPAHRFGYEFFLGPVPEGLQLDHIKERCASRHCVFYGHLDPVTSRENTMRGDGLAARFAAATQCIHGHPFAGENLRFEEGHRRCRECGRRRLREWKERKHTNAPGLTGA